MPLLWPGQSGSALDYISSPPPVRRKRKIKLVILGSTGSVGKNTLSIVEKHPDRFQILGLAGGKNVKLLAKQALRFRPPFLAVLDDAQAENLRQLLPADYGVKIFTSTSGYAAMASLPEADLIVSAQVGAAGFPATLSAALAGKTVALANKESLVLAGNLLRSICQETGASILPLDSEHFALFQCLAGRKQAVSRLVLTASGGPFRDFSTQELKSVKAEEALRHPNWNMGKKISIDSATMMNKALEIIEAHHLFGVPLERIDVLVHPQSIIHSMIVLEDNSMLAQLAVPDMRIPIAGCLFWPDSASPHLPPPDLVSLGALTFENIDPDRFTALNLPEKVIKNHKTKKINPAAVVMNAANEEAVNLFLDGQCGFDEITSLVYSAVIAFEYLDLESLPDWKDNKKGGIPEIAENIWKTIQDLDSRSRNFVKSCIKERTNKFL